MSIAPEPASVPDVLPSLPPARVPSHASLVVRGDRATVRSQPDAVLLCPTTSSLSPALPSPVFPRLPDVPRDRWQRGGNNPPRPSLLRLQ